LGSAAVRRAERQRGEREVYSGGGAAPPGKSSVGFGSAEDRARERVSRAPSGSEIVEAQWRPAPSYGDAADAAPREADAELGFARVERARLREDLARLDAELRRPAPFDLKGAERRTLERQMDALSVDLAAVESMVAALEQGPEQIKGVVRPYPQAMNPQAMNPQAMNPQAMNYY
jgi:hypothetical protein